MPQNRFNEWIAQKLRAPVAADSRAIIHQPERSLAELAGVGIAGTLLSTDCQFTRP